MAYIDLIQKIHSASKRDYLQERVIGLDKAACAEISKKFGYDYWDGDRKYGYGGYRYDGRWRPVAEDLSRHYGLSSGSSVVDLGCGKGYLLYELTQIHPGIMVRGIDISRYAIENAKEEVKPFITAGNATSLPYEDDYFDYIISITTLHNLYNYELRKALQEIERVGKQNKHVIVESYRNEREKANLLYWQLTCRSFYTPDEWEWFMAESGYTGDYSYIVFE